MGSPPGKPNPELLTDPEFITKVQMWRKQLNETELKVVLRWGSDDPLLLVGASGTFYFETLGYIHELGKSVDDIRPYLTALGSKKISDAPRRV